MHSSNFNFTSSELINKNIYPNVYDTCLWSDYSILCLPAKEDFAENFSLNCGGDFGMQ